MPEIVISPLVALLMLIHQPHPCVASGSYAAQFAFEVCTAWQPPGPVPAAEQK